MTQPYEVYFRRPDDAIVFAADPHAHEVSLLHRYPDDSWHCALCDSTECAHIEAARAAHGEREARA